ncbi:conjugal transfer protein TraF [Providencia sp. PROV255]|uniref:conjugal transfer protein TraF n=1 Tax=Providencia sp. PROV255 TaxID=2949943 RepID=UPI00234AD8D1|nr:conjugal transfer protein TraF [Providencia sp. PROV255]
MKFQSFSKTVIATLVFGVLSAHAVAESGKDKPKATNGQVTAGGTSFLDGKEEGWFWKKTPPEPPEEIEPEPTVAKADKAEDQDKQMPVPEPSVVVADEAGPEAFTVAWYRENVQKLRDRAIDEPTQENVRAYYLAQRIMLDKASRFTDMARLVTSTDPLIDESSRRSTSTFGAMDQSAEAEKNSRLVIKDIATRAGIFFFFRGEDCSICVKQAAVMNTFTYMTGMKVIPISVDGKPMPGNIMENWRTDTGQAAKLQINNTPALALAIPPEATRILSFGPLSADQLISRTIMIAHDSGLITNEQYKSTLPYNDNGYIDSNILKDMPEEYLENSDDFIKYIQKKSGYAVSTKPNNGSGGK